MDLVWQVLCKSLPEGRLQRIPRNPAHRDIVLAILAMHLERRYPYAETELNEVLEQALSGMHAKVDHVTCRRYLVDCGFLRRNRPGTRYFLVFPRLEATLSREARESAATLLPQALQYRSRARTGARPPAASAGSGQES